MLKQRQAQVHSKCNGRSYTKVIRVLVITHPISKISKMIIHSNNITSNFTHLKHSLRVRVTSPSVLCWTERSASLHPRTITASDDRSLFPMLLGGRRRQIIAANFARITQSNVSCPFTTRPTFVTVISAQNGIQLISN